MITKEIQIPEQLYIINSQKLLSSGLSLLDGRFNPGSSNPQEFHIRSHSENVLRRVQTMIGVANIAIPGLVSYRQESRTGLVAAHHDRIQKFDIKDPNTLQAQRERRRGQNEIDSAWELIADMDEINIMWGRRIFTLEDKSIVYQSIADATFPAFLPELKTVWQPRVDSSFPIEAIFLPLADLGGAGMDGRSQYFKEGNAEFREARIGITGAIKEALGNEGLGSVVGSSREYIESEMKKWLENQIGFASGRSIRIFTELGWFNNPILANALLENVFNKFEDSIEGAFQRAKIGQNAKFEELTAMFGYLGLLPELLLVT